LKIERIEIIPLKIPIKAWRISRGSMKNGGIVHVRIHTDDGEVGYGETMDVTPYTGAILEQLYFVLKNYLAPAIIGLDPFDQELIFDKMQRAIPGNELAKTAIEYALLDLMGKNVGLPVYKLLGGGFKTRIPVVGSVHIIPPGSAAESAVKQVKELGVKTIKIKIGDAESVERVRAVREAVGPEIKIRVDANAAYNISEAISVVKEMQRYDLETVEQPVPTIEGLAQVRKRIDAPVMADESIGCLRDALLVVEKRAADVAYLKPVKYGGLYNAKKLVAIFEAAEVPCVVGGMGGVSFSRVAVQHLAASSPQFHKGYAQDLMPVLVEAYGDINLLKESLFETMFENGHVIVPSKPGLGVEPDDDKISKFRVSL